MSWHEDLSDTTLDIEPRHLAKLGNSPRQSLEPPIYFIHDVVLKRLKLLDRCHFPFFFLPFSLCCVYCLLIVA